MKKIILFCFLFLVTQSFVFADEIIDVQGNIIPCKVETVEEGFIEYHKDGNLYKFIRKDNSDIFNDYVDVKTNFFKNDSIKRISGKIIVKDMWGVTIQSDTETIDIPFYSVKFVGVYKP